MSDDIDKQIEAQIMKVTNTNEQNTNEQNSEGVQLISAERRRQIESEGWSATHDDEHNEGELIEAANAYMHAAINSENSMMYRNTSPHSTWPWHAKDWKPSPDTIRNLVKAGALIAAEIDRLTRVKRRTPITSSARG